MGSKPRVLKMARQMYHTGCFRLAAQYMATSFMITSKTNSTMTQVGMLRRSSLKGISIGFLFCG